MVEPGADARTDGANDGASENGVSENGVSDDGVMGYEVPCAARDGESASEVETNDELAVMSVVETESTDQRESGTVLVTVDAGWTIQLPHI